MNSKLIHRRLLSEIVKQKWLLANKKRLVDSLPKISENEIYYDQVFVMREHLDGDLDGEQIETRLPDDVVKTARPRKPRKPYPEYQVWSSQYTPTSKSGGRFGKK